MQVQDLTTEQKFILQYSEFKTSRFPFCQGYTGEPVQLAISTARYITTKGALCSATIPNSSAQFVKHKRFYLGNELPVAEILFKKRKTFFIFCDAFILSPENFAFKSFNYYICAMYTMYVDI